MTNAFIAPRPSVHPDLARAMELLRKLAAEDKQTKIQITKPAPGASLVLPIDMEATWTTPIEQGSFKAQVNDGWQDFDVTSVFVIDSAAMKATATGVRFGDLSSDQPSATGRMSLTVGANLPLNLPSPHYERMYAGDEYHMAWPAFTLWIDGVEIVAGQPICARHVVRGSALILDINIFAYNGFATNVEISAIAEKTAAGPPELGITFNTPFVIKPQSHSHLLYISVDSNVNPGVYVIKLWGLASANVNGQPRSSIQNAMISLMVH